MHHRPSFLCSRKLIRSTSTTFRRHCGLFLSLLLLPQMLVAATGISHITVALKPDKNPDAMLQEREALKTFLEEKTGAQVEVIIPLSSAVIAEGLRNGSIDLAFVSATEMVPISEGGSGKILFAGEIDGKKSYQSYWLVRKDAPYATIEDLRGKPVAFSSRTSTSGFLIPLKDLKDRGLVERVADLESFFGKGQVLFGTGYVSAVERVLSGEADAAAVSDYVFDKDKHLTPEQKSRLRVLQAQGPVPTHVLALSRKTEPEVEESLRAAVEALNSGPHTGLRDKVFTSRLVEVDEKEHLAPVSEALRLSLDQGN